MVKYMFGTVHANGTVHVYLILKTKEIIPLSGTAFPSCFISYGNHFHIRQLDYERIIIHFFRVDVIMPLSWSKPKMPLPLLLSSKF